jgi:hypothetical protein
MDALYLSCGVGWSVTIPPPRSWPSCSVRDPRRGDRDAPHDFGLGRCSLLVAWRIYMVPCSAHLAPIGSRRHRFHTRVNPLLTNHVGNAVAPARPGVGGSSTCLEPDSCNRQGCGVWGVDELLTVLPSPSRCRHLPWIGVCAATFW